MTLESGMNEVLLSKKYANSNRAFLLASLSSPPTTGSLLSHLQPLEFTIQLVQALTDTLSTLLRVDSMVRIEKNSEKRRGIVKSKRHSTFGLLGDLDFASDDSGSEDDSE